MPYDSLITHCGDSPTFTKTKIQTNFHCLYAHFIYILFKYIQQKEAKYTHLYLNTSQKHQLVKSAGFRQENISKYWFWLCFHNVHRPLTFLNCGEREFSLDSSMVWLLGGWPHTRKGPLSRLLKQQRLDSMTKTKKEKEKISKLVGREWKWGGRMNAFKIKYC